MTESTTRLDPALAVEFHANPLGPFAPALDRLVNTMRRAPLPGKHFLIRDSVTQELILAQQGLRRGAPFVRHDAIRFKTKTEAEWYVFCLRWRAMTGEAPPHDVVGNGLGRDAP